MTNIESTPVLGAEAAPEVDTRAEEAKFWQCRFQVSLKLPDGSKKKVEVRSQNKLSAASEVLVTHPGASVQRVDPV